MRALIAGACVVSVAALHTTPAHADGNADEADLHFEAGAEAYAKGDFRTALEHFLVSNRLVPNRNVVFNVARTYEQLKRFADAHRYYVDALQGETNPQTSAAIQDAIKRIAPNVAVLRIESDPPGATVFIDRKDLGSRGRAPRPLAIAEGKYKVIVELDGYEPASVDGVQAKIGSETVVPFKLKRIVGTVAVSVEGASGAAVHLDDEASPAVCTAPCTFDAPPGTHFVYFSRDGFQATPRQINVVAKETTKTAAVLTPLTGSLVVQADERDAIVEIDGKPAGFTPAVIQNVSVGGRKIRVTLRGYAPAEREVTIKANQQTQLLDLKLVPLRQVAAASRFTENIEDAPSSVTIIDGQELRAFGYPTIAEALRGTRGIALSYDRIYWSAAIRGLGDPRDYNNRLLVLQDGTVMNDNILAASFIGSDARADLDDVERIEVVRGPGSIVYGTGAMSGVVNMVPRGKEEENSVNISGGTYENGTLHARLGFHLNFNKSKTAGMWASVSGARSDGFNLDVEPRYEPGTTVTLHQVDFFRSYGTAGRIWVGPITAQWFFHSRDQTVTTGPYGILPDDGRTLYRDQRFMAEIRAEPKISSTFEIMARLYAQRYAYHGSYVYAPFVDGYDEDYSGTWIGGEARTVITPTPSLRLTVGGEVQGDPEANMFGCGYYKENGNQCPKDGTTHDTAYMYPDTYLNVQQSYMTGAAYGLVDWGAAKWVRLSAGVRGDFSSLLSPQIVARGAIILKPWNGGVAKIMGGNAFRRPSIFERYYWDGGVGFIQSEDPGNKTALHPVEGGLKAETILNGELELSQRFLEDWTALGSVHVNRIENVITAIRVDPNTGEPNADSTTTQFQNSPAPALNVGFDVELRRDWRQGWMMSAFYGYQRPQFVGLDPAGALATQFPSLKTNPRLTNAPEHLGGFRGAVPVVPDLATLGARVTVEGPRRVSYSSDEVTKPTAVADIVLSGNVKKFGVGYAIGVYNIADVRYKLPITESYFSRLSPQNGRTFMANVSVTYP